MNIPDLNNISPELLAKMIVLKKHHEHLRQREDVDIDREWIIPFTFAVRSRTGEVVMIEGPCACWPNRQQITEIIRSLQQILILSDEEIERYNLLRETKIYESQIDSMMGFDKKKISTRPPQSGYIYLVDDGCGNTKIGRTRNWRSRLSGYPPSCSTIMVAAVEDHVQEEKTLLERYIDKRINGEWFLLTKEDISSITQEYSDRIVKEAL